eukprot:862779-Prymnesium_polylepis.1
MAARTAWEQAAELLERFVLNILCCGDSALCAAHAGSALVQRGETKRVSLIPVRRAKSRPDAPSKAQSKPQALSKADSKSGTPAYGGRRASIYDKMTRLHSFDVRGAEAVPLPELPRCAPQRARR